MFDIYKVNLKTGLMEYIKSYETAPEAVKTIAHFYAIDGAQHCTGSNYYYMQEDKT